MTIRLVKPLCQVSLPAWGVWIEMEAMADLADTITSLPAWGVWIEIVHAVHVIETVIVTPRMGSVD